MPIDIILTDTNSEVLNSKCFVKMLNGIVIVYFLFTLSGIFSPIGSNVPADTNSQQSLHPKGELLATSDSNTTVDMQRPIDQQPIANEPPVSPLKNVRTSATRSLTELGTAGRDQTHESMQKSYSDTKLITNNKHMSGAMTRGNLGLSAGMLHQPMAGNALGIVNEDNREQSKNPLPGTQSRRPSQGFSVSYWHLDRCRICKSPSVNLLLWYPSFFKSSTTPRKLRKW